MTKGRWLLASILLAGVGAATVQGLRPHPPPPVEVTTAAVKKQDLTRTVNAAGHVQAREMVKISSNVTGDLLALSVQEGDHVRAGQVLGQIDKRLYATLVAQFRGSVASSVAQAAQAEATLAQDRKNLARSRMLVAESLASVADLEKAETQLKLDEAGLASQRQLVAQNQGQLESALYNLSRATLEAPIDGTILELYHKVGERIRGSDFSEDVVMLMGGLSDMEVKAEVGEHEVVGIRPGNDAAVEVDAIPDRQFKGHVVAVGKNAQVKNPGTDAEVTTFFVRVGLDAPPEGVLPGMSASVSISTATHPEVLVVPIQAVTSREPKKEDAKPPGDTRLAGARTDDPAPAVASVKPKPAKVVFVVAKDGTAQMRVVHTGIASRTDVEILDGVAEGETIVEGPYRTLARELKEGQTVKVQQKPAPGEADKGARGGPI